MSVPPSSVPSASPCPTKPWKLISCVFTIYIWGLSQASSSLSGSLPKTSLSLPPASQQPSIHLPGSPHGALPKPGSDHFTFLQNTLQLGSSPSFPHPQPHSNLNTYLCNPTKLSVATPTHHVFFLPLGLRLTTTACQTPTPGTDSTQMPPPLKSLL